MPTPTPEMTAENLTRTGLETAESELRYDRTRSLAYLAGSFPVSLLAMLGQLDPWPAGTAIAAAVAGAAWHFGRSRMASARRRQILDEFIVNGWHNLATEAIEERAAELVAPNHRSRLARSVHAHTKPIAPGAPLLQVQSRAFLAELQRQRASLERLAGRLRDLSQPVNPRGVVLLERLLLDIVSPGQEPQLARVIARVERELEP